MTIKLFAAGNLFARLFLRASFPLLFSLYILLSLYILPASQHSNAKSPQDTKIQNFFLYYTTNCQPGASAIENRCIQERLLSFKCKRSQKHPGAYNPPSRLFTGQRNISSISTKLPNLTAISNIRGDLRKIFRLRPMLLSLLFQADSLQTEYFGSKYAAS
jgi:hypothetical protein